MRATFWTVPAGLLALSIFFAGGAVVAATTCIALLMPGGVLEPIWRLNPPAHSAFLELGPWAIVLMAMVALMCGGAACGLWIRARWGHRLALSLLLVNLLGDVVNAVVRGDPRTLIGVPIAGLLILYLLSPGVRSGYRGTPLGG